VDKWGVAKFPKRRGTPAFPLVNLPLAHCQPVRPHQHGHIGVSPEERGKTTSAWSSGRRDDYAAVRRVADLAAITAAGSSA
jgi:hypothetical protein